MVRTAGDYLTFDSDAIGWLVFFAWKPGTSDVEVYEVLERDVETGLVVPAPEAWATFQIEKYGKGVVQQEYFESACRNWMKDMNAPHTQDCPEGCCC